MAREPEHHAERSSKRVALEARSKGAEKDRIVVVVSWRAEMFLPYLIVHLKRTLAPSRRA